ncbi:DUF4244 domain-containing protein [Amycolatopsis sp. K13G38]|uniref:DUF4244 domain-containing protein n=1 Tax=Amycolatopsis acididurans TaxID=2724524 RepID=A0ABX1JKT4_9PSEU|nr:DUF4244 domain-containing protein [Amycolatopsis acididurans]NKQ59110.1 DUF4244 domain-containing protein [Amycolatopsis acididurans]
MFWQTNGRHAAARKPRWWRRWFRTVIVEDDGMSTAEYAIGTVAAAAFAGMLYLILSGDSTMGMLLSIVQRALTGPS